MRRATAVAALLVAPALVAVAPARPAGAATTCAAAPAGMASVAVVVDTGSGEPLVRCVTVKEGATGLDAMRATGLTFRNDDPASGKVGGFLCAINGLPATGCAQVSAKSVAYWAYYRQASGLPWAYSRVGYATPIGTRCWVEGWRWVTNGGVAASQNASPRVAPPSVACPAPTATTAPVAPPPRAAVPTTAAPQARPGVAAPATTAAPGVSAAPAAPVPTTTVPDAQVAGRTTVPTPSTSTTASAPGRVADVGERAQAARASRADSAARPSSGGGVPWVAVGAVAVAGLIGLGTFLRGRHDG